MDEVEGRIDQTETVLQVTPLLIKQLMQRQNNLEARLIEQEGQAWRSNLRIYEIPEEREGTNMVRTLQSRSVIICMKNLCSISETGSGRGGSLDNMAEKKEFHDNVHF